MDWRLLKSSPIVSTQEMVALNKQERYAEIFLRHGQVPFGQNPYADPSLEEVSLSGARISAGLSEVLTSDDVFRLVNPMEIPRQEIR